MAVRSGDELLDHLARSFRRFVEVDCNRYTPLYAKLALGTAEDRELLELLARGRPGQQRPVLLLAAVHDLLLEDPDAELARFYPSVSGEPVPPGDPFPAFRNLCLERRDALVELLTTRTTQTNEVNRSVAVRAGIAAASADVPDRAIALLDLGTSAGLNLAFDRYELAGRFGPADARVQLLCVEEGSIAPSYGLPPGGVIWRRGLDQRPISVADEREVRWLEACLWPEQVERIERFRAAVAMARLDPPQLTAGDIVDDLGGVAAEAPPEAHLVIFHSWVLTYLKRSRRAALGEAIAQVAATRAAVSWLSAEAPNVVPGLMPPAVPAGATEEIRLATVLGLQCFRDGAPLGPNTAVARCHPHLRWLEWLEAAPVAG